MNIKNYTSEVPPTTSMANIEKWLIEIGASNINKTYKGKVCVGIKFLYYDQALGQSLAFELKADVEGCFKKFWAERSKKTDQARDICMLQANRTAWKIISDWAELQCTMIILQQGTPLQMFLSFWLDQKDNETLYEKIVAGKTQLLLPSTKK